MMPSTNTFRDGKPDVQDTEDPFSSVLGAYLAGAGWSIEPYPCYIHVHALTN